MARPTLPLRVTQKAGGTPVVLLGDMEIQEFIAAEGLAIEYTSQDYLGSVPTVTITFGPGALDLDFAVDLLERLLDDARGKADG